VPWRIRLIDRERRVVVRLKRTREGATLRGRWIAFHTVSPVWADVFMRMLRLAGVDTSPKAARLRADSSVRGASARLLVGDNGGEVSWKAGARWTTIDVALTKGSARKQELIAAAIAKAARYY
jgi:hypothetical protein